MGPVIGGRAKRPCGSQQRQARSSLPQTFIVFSREPRAVSLQIWARGLINGVCPYKEAVHGCLKVDKTTQNQWDDCQIHVWRFGKHDVAPCKGLPISVPLSVFKSTTNVTPLALTAEMVQLRRELKLLSVDNVRGFRLPQPMARDLYNGRRLFIRPSSYALAAGAPPPTSQQIVINCSHPVVLGLTMPVTRPAQTSRPSRS